MAKPNFIHTAIKHVGALHKALGIPGGQDIPDATLKKHASGDSVMAHRARLAITLKHLHQSDQAGGMKEALNAVPPEPVAPPTTAGGGQ